MEKDMLCLPNPKKESHKGMNGVVLVIGGSKTYHGAPILCALAAVRFCDLVYFSSIPENLRVLYRMKIASPNIIAVGKGKFKMAFEHSDCVLVGNGMDLGASTKSIVAKVLLSKKRCVLDAAAIRVLCGKVQKKGRAAPLLGLLHENAILTPHKREFEAAFSCAPTEENVKKVSAKYGCTILLKGRADLISCRGKAVKVEGGNAGMTKGGTGDVLAGLLAAIFSTCKSPERAAYTASFLNKKAGESLFERYRYNFSSEDLANELALVAAKLY